MLDLEELKLELRITTDVFENELTSLIERAVADLGLAGIVSNVLTADYPAIIQQAIVTFCKMNFGEKDPSVYDRLKRSYDEQKAQLMTATGYTDWLED